MMNMLKLIQDMYPHLREKYNYILDKRLFWEMFKMEIRSQTIAFAKGKAGVFNQREVEVKELLYKLDDVICNSTNLENLTSELKQYDDLKQELHLIYERKAKAAMYRSKCRWVESGEKPNRYFFNLEKRNYTEKVIMELEDENEEVFVDEKHILATIESFYKDHYSSKLSASEVEFSKFTHNINFPQLPDDERDQRKG